MVIPRAGITPRADTTSTPSFRAVRSVSLAPKGTQHNVECPRVIEGAGASLPAPVPFEGVQAEREGGELLTGSCSELKKGRRDYAEQDKTVVVSDSYSRLVCVQGGLDHGGRSVNPSPRTSSVSEKTSSRQFRCCIFIQPALGLVARRFEHLRVIPLQPVFAPVPTHKDANG